MRVADDDDADEDSENWKKLMIEIVFLQRLVWLYWYYLW